VNTYWQSQWHPANWKPGKVRALAKASFSATIFPYICAACIRDWPYRKEGRHVETSRRERLTAIVANPSESFDVELKQWIDPSSEDGKAKIVKACLALRNNNGGMLLIGFKDDGTIDKDVSPDNLVSAWHIDRIQELISKYASEPFAIAIDLIEGHPVVDVPSGIRTPVACRSDLPADGRLLKCHAIYVRTLHSNNIISSSEATYKDWPRLAEICFDNREANIGAFVRRHLSGMNLKEVFASFDAKDIRDLAKPQEIAFLDFGRRRFAAQWQERLKEAIPDLGTMEISVVADGPSSPVPLSQNTLWKIDSSIPRISGWPPWVGLSAAPDNSLHPYVFNDECNDGWEAFISGGVIGPHLDFWRIEPAGRLYHLRMLEDDLRPSQDMPEPRTSLDYYLQIIRVAEFVAVAIRIIRALNFEAEPTELTTAFRWTHLKNRKLWIIRKNLTHNSGNIVRGVVLGVSTWIAAFAW
jgi:hypothetical protein